MAKKKDQFESDSLERPGAGEAQKELTIIHHPSIIADDIKLLHKLQVHNYEMELQDEDLRLCQFVCNQLNARYKDLKINL